MRFVWTVPVVCLLAACGSNSPSSGEPTGGYPFSFSVSTADFGSMNYACSSDSSSVTTLNGFLASCDMDETVSGSSEQMTETVIQIAGYHGSDTYAFQGSDGMTASFVQFDLANHIFRSSPASPGIPGTTCSVVLTGPPKLSAGDQVSGTFHCDNIVGFVISGDAGYYPPSTTSADGQFAGTVLF
jgi:hypothetical protein